MADVDLPLIVEPEQLQPLLGTEGLLVVDLCKASVYEQIHIPGAVFLEYTQILAMKRPVGGLLPDDEQLSRVLSGIGLTPETHVVAYDDEGGGKAARLLWTLDMLGHARYSLLNGGLHAWYKEGFPTTAEPTEARPSDYRAEIQPESPACADREFIESRLGEPNFALLDARTPEEYSGEKRFSQRGGHIPGAANLDWMQAMDQGRNLRLKPTDELMAMLEERGITPDKTVVTYCQTHHRSAHSYIMLKALGFPEVRGYPGSWSEWGNLPDTPVEE
ncbi:MAG TPA: sulfurtransferase [Gammaproteobacteria bacterium]|nr:sulfurtransferase [Gammaproteobacteria bacterium]